VPMVISVDTGHQLGNLRDECERLKKHLQDRATKDTGMMEAKRCAAEGKEAVVQIKAVWDHKMAMEKRDHDKARAEDEQRIARYEKKLADNAKRISSLESEITALKKAPPTLPPAVAKLLSAAAAPPPATPPPADPPPAAPPPAAPPPAAPPPAAPPADELTIVLRRLKLEKYRTSLEEEELDVPLLRSMGCEVLASNMAELGMTADEAARLVDELCPPVAVS
jgi:hypothetical protein